MGAAHGGGAAAGKHLTLPMAGKAAARVATPPDFRAGSGPEINDA